MLCRIPLNTLKEPRFTPLNQAITQGRYVIDDILGDSLAILAGGSLRTLLDKEDVVQDFDLFFTNKENISKVEDILEGEEYVCIFQCPLGHLQSWILFGEDTQDKDGNVVKTVLSKVQLITRDEYKSAFEIIDSFDFAATCAATDGEYLYFTLDWVKSVKTKKMMLHRITYPVATLNRIDKYKRKGYHATEQFYQDIVFAIRGGSFDGERLGLYID